MWHSGCLFLAPACQLTASVHADKHYVHLHDCCDLHYLCDQILTFHGVLMMLLHCICMVAPQTICVLLHAALVR